MAEAETGNITLPPSEKFHLEADGLRAWRPEFERIRVCPTPGGGCALRMQRYAGAVEEWRLSAEEAAHLARLLTEGVERPAAAPAPAADASPRPQAAE